MPHDSSTNHREGVHPPPQRTATTRNTSEIFPKNTQNYERCNAVPRGEHGTGCFHVAGAGKYTRNPLGTRVTFTVESDFIVVLRSDKQVGLEI